MDITINFNGSGLTIRNTSSNAITIPLGPGNSFNFPNGASVVPPYGKYWHIDMTTAQGGVSLGGTHGPVNMPGGSSVVFYIDPV